MSGYRELSVTTSTGDVAVVDFGGSGPDVLLVHDLTENAAVWAPVARLLVPDCHVVAVDLPAHGRTSATATDLAQMHDVLAQALPVLGLQDPILVGQGAGGGYATIEHCLGLPARGLVLLEGAFPVDLDDLRRYIEEIFSAEVCELIEQRYGFGLRAADAAERDAATESLVATSLTDWNFEGVVEDDLRAMIARSWARDEGGWVRRPTTRDYVALMRIDLGFDPRLDSYLDRLDLPMVLLQASGGVYNEFPQAFEDFVAARPDRRLDVLDATWTLSFGHPERVAEEIRSLR